MTTQDTINIVSETTAKAVVQEVKKSESEVAAQESRRLSLIWEYTQAGIAIVVVIANMAAGLISTIKDNKVEISSMLTSALFLVLGFYFGRTQQTGRTGRRERSSDQFRRGK